MKLVNFLSKQLIANGQLKEEDQEIFEYGAHYFVVLSCHMIITILMGAYLNIFLESAIFLASFIIIRIYAGGCHAKTEWGCFLASTLLNAVALILIKTNCYRFPVFYIVVAVCWISIFLLSPIEAKSKPLVLEEEKYFRFMARIFLSIEGFMFLGFCIIRLHNYATAISVSWIMVTFLLIIGIVQDKK